MAKAIKLIDHLVEKIREAKRTIAQVNSVYILRDVQRDFTLQDKIDYYDARKTLLRKAVELLPVTEPKKSRQRLERKLYSTLRKLTYLVLDNPLIQ